MHGTMQMLVRRSANAGNHAAFPAIARGTPRDALDQLEQFGTTVTIPHDGEIVGHGDAAESCYRILSGCVRQVTLMEDGRRQVGEFLLAVICSVSTRWRRTISRRRRCPTWYCGGIRGAW